MSAEVRYAGNLIATVERGTTTLATSGKWMTSDIEITETIVPLVPLYYDYNIGYISNGAWIWEDPTDTYTDIYEVEGNKTYIISLGENVGSRFRSLFTTTDITTITSGRVSGTKILEMNNPPSYSAVVFKTTEPGYILVSKDNVGVSGLISYVFDMAGALI